MNSDFKTINVQNIDDDMRIYEQTIAAIKIRYLLKCVLIIDRTLRLTKRMF